MVAVELRRARPADAEAVEDYHHRCFLSRYAAHLAAGGFEPPERAGTRRQLHDWFSPGSDCATVVAVDDGTPIGHATVSGNRPSTSSSAPAPGPGPGPAPAGPGRGGAGHGPGR